MKKFLAMLLIAVLALSFVACGSNDEPNASEGDNEIVTGDAPEFVTVKTLNGDRQAIELEIPYNPERLAVMELGALDILDNLGAGDRIVGVSKGSSIDYLQKYVDDDSLFNLGTIKEADLEAVMEAEPDVIFIGGRLASYYDELSAIAPVIFMSIDSELGVIEGTASNARMIASLFGLEDQVSDVLAGYEARIEALQAFAEGKTAIVSMMNAGGLGVLGNDGRCSIIGREIGFENIGIDAEIDTSTHGNEASFEFLVSVDPDYVFIMDRDAAIGTEGAQLAPEVMDNELVHMTQAWQNDQIVYLAHSNIWYTAEGGITALSIMLDDLEAGIFN